jgi:hypothetical protein
MFVRFSRAFPEHLVEGALLSNFIKNKDFWIGAFDDQTYREWKGKTDSLEYTYDKDLRKILDTCVDDYGGNFKIMFKEIDGQQPSILQLLLDETISLESFCVLCSVFPVFTCLDRNIEIPIMWKPIKNLVEKYSPFLKIDKNKYKLLTEDIIKNNYEEYLLDKRG